MNKVKLVCLATLLASATVQAAPACKDFEINIENRLSQDLVASNIHFADNRANIQPSTIQIIKSGATQAFTLSNVAEDNQPLHGYLTFHTKDLPSKKYSVHFTLENTGPICVHKDISVQDALLNHTRTPGKIKYTIG